MAGEPGELAAETIRRLEIGGDLLELPPGSRIGRYELLEVLGQGGFGITYRARDVELGRDVAIKEYLPSSFSFRRADGTVVARSTQAADTFIWGRERFAEEARILARLERVPGVVNVYDIVSANGTAYMVMEYVQGQTLETLLKSRGMLDQGTIERILPPLLDGLEWVHAAGFLHRDIKPANILIDEDWRPLLIDFGASRMALQGRTQALTAVYTPGYAAFEQFTSAKQGPPADIYALGATLYHAVTGKVPPGANDRMVEDRLVPAVITGKGRYRAGLLTAIDAALRLKAADRPQTIEAWRRQLGVGAAPTGAPHARRRRWPAWAGVVLVVAGLGAAAPYMWDRFVLGPQRAAEKAASDRAAADKVTADKVAADKVAADKARAEREQIERATAERAAAERAAADKARADDETRRRVALAAAQKAAADKAEAENAAVEPAERPSFDCARASRAEEHLICGDAALAASDGRLGRAYVALRERLDPAERRRLDTEQFTWLRDRSQRCGIEPTTTLTEYNRPGFAQCFLASHRQRMEQLQSSSAAIAPPPTSSLNSPQLPTGPAQINPAIAKAAMERGNQFLNQRLYERAIAEYNIAIANDHPSKFAFLNRGAALHALRRYSEAVRDYSASLRIDPNYAPALYARGLASRKLGNVAASENDLAAARRIVSDIDRRFADPVWH